VRRAAIACAFAAIPMIPAACDVPGFETSSGTLTHRVDTIAGVVHIRSSGQPPAWSARKIVSVGSVGSTGERAPDGSRPAASHPKRLPRCGEPGAGMEADRLV